MLYSVALFLKASGYMCVCACLHVCACEEHCQRLKDLMSSFCLSPGFSFTSRDLLLLQSPSLCVSRSLVCSGSASLSASACNDVSPASRHRWGADELTLLFFVSTLPPLSLSFLLYLSFELSPLTPTFHRSLFLSVFEHQCDSGHCGDGRGPRDDLRSAGRPLPPPEHMQHPAGGKQPAQHPAHLPTAAPPATPQPPAGLQRRSRLLRLRRGGREGREAGNP